jgi:hypothetical protein
MMRTARAISAAAVVAAVTAIATGAARADALRHTMIPKDVWGTWAAKREFCTSHDKSSLITIRDAGSTGPLENCVVEYVDEAAGQSGPAYSAHMQCTDKDDPTKVTDGTFIVIPRGDTLSAGSDFLDLQTFFRCPVTN